MKKRIGGMTTIGVAMALSLVCGASGAQDLGKLGSMIPGGSMTSGSMGNVAGLLEYCVKNNYLGGNSGASGIKDQLLGKMAGSSNSTASSGEKSSSASDMLGQLTGSKDKHAASSSTGGSPTSDAGYLSGTKGILQGSDGKTTDLAGLGGGSSDLKTQLTTKACDMVLKQGKSFLGH